MKVKWLDKPLKHDYSAAASYLSLMMDLPAAKNVTKKLKKGKMMEFAAKDISRASGLSLLGISDSHVEKDRAQIARNEKLSPVLLYRDKANLSAVGSPKFVTDPKIEPSPRSSGHNPIGKGKSSCSLKCSGKRML